MTDGVFTSATPSFEVTPTVRSVRAMARRLRPEVVAIGLGAASNAAGLAAFGLIVVDGSFWSVTGLAATTALLGIGGRRAALSSGADTRSPNDRAVM